MNPTKDAALWAVSLLPDAAPEWAIGITAFAGIVGALVAIAAPPCLLAALLTHHKEKRHG